jgi:ABC-2 type transport system ATP-binding protein
MIEMEQVSKTYKSARIPALSEVSLTISGGAFGLLGPNGAGKTTLMRILATLVSPSAGRAAVAGHDVGTGRAAIRRLLGFLPQDFGFYPRLTAYENLDYLALLSGLGRERRVRIEEALQRVNLQDVARKRVGAFSGGMRQRLGIAQALLNRPTVLIVDEPTVGLDPSERVRFRTLLAELASRATVLLSTHIVADVASTCTDLAVLRQGRIVYRGATSGLIAQARGQVWGAMVTPAQLPAIEAVCTVAAANATQAGLEVRLVGTPPPGLEVTPLEPTLEDGYLAVVETSPAPADRQTPRRSRFAAGEPSTISETSG